MEFNDPDEYTKIVPKAPDCVAARQCYHKKDAKVRPLETAAMNLIHKYAPSIPVPFIEGYDFRYRGGVAYYGELLMDYIPGETLMAAWAKLDDQGKGRICQDIWDIVATIRSSVPRPKDLAPGLNRTVDGHPSYDRDNNDVTPREMTQTRPEPWDISAFRKAWRVLF